MKAMRGKAFGLAAWGKGDAGYGVDVVYYKHQPSTAEQNVSRLSM